MIETIYYMKICLQYLANIPVLNHCIIYINKWLLLLLVFILSIVVIAISNQIKSFSPSAIERPLPYKYRLMVNSLYFAKFIIFFYFTYLWTFNALLWFLYNINFFLGSDAVLLWQYHFISATFYYLFIILATLSKFDQLPIIKAWVDRVIIERLNFISKQYQKKHTRRNIYNPDGKNRETKNFKVQQYFKENYLFHGIDESNKPIYTPLNESLDGHFTIIGGSGMGKGVLTRTYLAQTIRHKISHIVFDPKPDGFMFNACKSFSNQANKKIHIIDLDSNTPQISLFKSIDKEAFKNIFMSTLELQKQKQTNARVYAERAERMLFEIAETVYKENITPIELYHDMNEKVDHNGEETLNNLFYYLNKCNVFNTKKGLDLSTSIERGETIFIRCSNAKSTDVSRKIAQVVFSTVFEHIKKRDKTDATPCILVIDEFKFVMNTSIMDNLATIRDQKGTLIFNFQDISNFTTSPNEALRNPAYAKELLSNSHFIAIHNVNDIELCKIIQQRAGKSTYHKAFEEDTSNTGGVGETSAHRRFTTHVEYVLTENEISTGGKRTAILLSPLLPQKVSRLHTDIIKTKSYYFNTNINAIPILEETKSKPKKINHEIQKNTNFNSKDIKHNLKNKEYHSTKNTNSNVEIEDWNETIESFDSSKY